MNLYKFHSNPSELIRGEDKDRVLSNMVRDKLGYTSRFTPALVTATVDQLGAGWGDEGEPGGSNLVEILDDIYKHGMVRGFSGFTHYSETMEFYTKNRDEINEHLEHEGLDYDVNINDSLYDLDIDLTQDEMGAMSMVLGFNCAKNSTADDVYFTMYEVMSSDEDYMVANCISWYVAESIAYEFNHIMTGEY